MVQAVKNCRNVPHHLFGDVKILKPCYGPLGNYLNMTTVLLVIHLLIAIGLVGVVLMQRSEGGGLGMGGGGGGMGGFMTGRATADLLTRATGILAALFMATSLTLAILANTKNDSGSVLGEFQPVGPSDQAPGAPSAPLAN